MCLLTTPSFLSTATLRRNNASEFEVPQKRLLRCIRGEVRDETVPDVLVRIGTLQRPVVQVLRRANEGCKRAIIQCFRKCIVGAQPEISTEVLVCRDGQAMVDTVSAVIGVVQKPRG